EQGLVAVGQLAAGETLNATGFDRPAEHRIDVQRDNDLGDVALEFEADLPDAFELAAIDIEQRHPGELLCDSFDESRQHVGERLASCELFQGGKQAIERYRGRVGGFVLQPLGPLGQL